MVRDGSVLSKRSMPPLPPPRYTGCSVLGERALVLKAVSQPINVVFEISRCTMQG